MTPRKRTSKSDPETLNRLIAFGDLLSKKQQLYAQLHHREGLSLAEIARRQGVSRQAVLCTIQHAERRLREISDHVAHHHVGMPEANERLTQVAARLRDLRTRVAHQGIIYSTDWIVRELDLALEALGETHPGAMN